MLSMNSLRAFVAFPMLIIRGVVNLEDRKWEELAAFLRPTDVRLICSSMGKLFTVPAPRATLARPP